MRHILYLTLLLLATTLTANNITVSNISLTGQLPDNGTTQIEFDLSWENSWRLSVGPANWDAAWVFAKFRVNGGEWGHCELFDATAPAGVTAEIRDRDGAMIYRATDGSGNVDWRDLRLGWEYNANGVGDNDIVDVQVFAIEMVYVPEGAFWLGSNDDSAERETNSFYEFAAAPAGQFSAYRVESEAAITIGTVGGNLYYDVDNDLSRAGDQMGSLGALYPKGFGAYYCMKYEMSQEQYVTFFNTLSQAQKENNDATGPDGKNSDEVIAQNGVSWSGNGNATTSLPNVAMNFITTNTSLAYLAWAALRPMTELEYEKACRGPLAPVDGEFAWGNARIFDEPYEYTNQGDFNSRITNPGTGTGNVLYRATEFNGPLRNGIFAASAANASREETGGTYYGIMEMSGNVYERIVTVGNRRGRLFRGNHGGGELNASGFASIPFWPNNLSGEGIGYRGGGFIVSANLLRLADRADGATVHNIAINRLSIRGVRSAQ